jgi:hypothetical protein
MSNQTSEGLTGNFKKAFDELLALGAPVVNPEGTGYDQYTHDCCQFVIDGEAGETNFLDYYPASYSIWYNGTYCDEIHEILQKYGLYGEWANPAVLTICEA